MQKIELEVIGVSNYTNPDSSAQILMLKEKNASKRLSVIIGQVEAQTIYLQLHNYKTTRPHSIDLIHSLCNNFDIEILEVLITNFERGIYYTEIVCKEKKSNQEIHIESRCSDAIAIAIKCKCKIFTNEIVMQKAGFDWDTIIPEISQNKKELEQLSDIELDNVLKKAIKNEDYELASKIRDEKKKREKGE